MQKLLFMKNLLKVIFVSFLLLNISSVEAQKKGENNKGEKMKIFLLENGVSRDKLPAVKKEIRSSLKESFMNKETFVIDSKLRKYLSEEAGLSNEKIDELSAKLAKRSKKHKANFKGKGHKKAKRRKKGNKRAGGELHAFLFKNGVQVSKIPAIQKEIHTNMKASFNRGETFVMGPVLKTYLSKEAGLTNDKIEELSIKLTEKCKRHTAHLKRQADKKNKGKGNKKGGKLRTFLMDNGVDESKIPSVQKQIRINLKSSFKSGDAFVMDAKLKTFLSQEAGLSNEAIDKLSVKLTSRCEKRNAKYKKKN